jgi:hypothetical protein
MIAVLVAQAVVALCAQLGVPFLAGPATSLAMLLVNTIEHAIPPEKLEQVALSVARSAVLWLAARPPGPEPTPDFGGNTAAVFGSGPPVVTRPEPDEGADLGGNTRAPDVAEVERRAEPENGRDPPP